MIYKSLSIDVTGVFKTLSRLRPIHCIHLLDKIAPNLPYFSIVSQTGQCVFLTDDAVYALAALTHVQFLKWRALAYLDR